MSQLIHIKQRLYAVATIKKITHAMRLISMSAHTRMQKKSTPVRASHETIIDLVQNTFETYPMWENPILRPPKGTNNLIILIGSQKGLCGNFNNLLFAFFESKFSKELSNEFPHDLQCISIGKKAADFLRVNKKVTLIKQYDSLSMSRIKTIVTDLTNYILHAQPVYSSIIVVSSKLKNFFVHRPHIHHLIPFDIPEPQQTEALRWEQPQQQIFDYLTYEYVYLSIYYYLFESVLAEQATRFLAMDKSTRNADQMIDEMNLMYNKLRQAKITRELTELMASF